MFQEIGNSLLDLFDVAGITDHKALWSCPQARKTAVIFAIKKSGLFSNMNRPFF